MNLKKKYFQIQEFQKKLKKKKRNITTGEQGGGNSFLALMQAYPIFLH